ncbi:MAG TPA: peptidoglycan DD-metalloendopeptidase family protein [Candidatus Paceibacterota bacterium]|nr:peptidoglycan DD-metalloendopeptidase family protein [Candidatus Paceibacterota bacterium]
MITKGLPNLLLFILIFSPFSYISANIFNFFERSDYNSQNIDVLEVKSTVSQSIFSIGGGEISIVDDVALSFDTTVINFSSELNRLKNNGKISVYEVREGDTLSQIAEMYDVSVNTIRWANDFSGPIKPGQSLIILPVSGLTHVVKNGGTIEDIAKIYKADVREIALFNGIDIDKKLVPGDKIIVPNVDLVPTKDNNNSQTKSSLVTTGAQSQTSSVSATGNYFRNPVPGAILTQSLHGYNAVDLGAPVGTPIIASAAGKVLTSKSDGWNGGYGAMIIISHPNGTQTLYSHLSRNTVSVGQNVSAGETIGYVGSTGLSTGPHLHFEIRGARNPLAACRVGSVCRI